MAKKRRIKEPISTSQIDPESLLAMMLKYHKALAKEAREDERALRAAMKIELGAKATKLDLEIARINQLKEEAGERFDRAMSAAHAAMVTGIVQGQLASATGDFMISVPPEKGVGMKSDLIHLQIRHQEDEVEKAAKRVAAAGDAADDARRRKQAIADAIKKLLDIMAGIKPQV